MGRTAVTSGRAASQTGERVGGLAVAAGDVGFGGQALVEVGEEGGAEAADHRPDADVDGEGEEERHQGQRQAAEPLAGVGPGPGGDRTPGPAGAEGQRGGEAGGQREGGAEEEAGHRGEAGDEAGAEARAEGERGEGEEPEDERRRELEAEEAALALEPGLRPRRGEEGQRRGAPQADGGGGEGARDAHRDAPRPPGGAEREVARQAGAGEAAERGGDVGEERGGDGIAGGGADETGENGDQEELRDEGEAEAAGGDAAGTERAEGRAALLEGEADGGVDDEEADDEGEEAEGGQVEVEAVGQPVEVAAGRGSGDRHAGGELGWERAGGVGGRHYHPRDAAGGVEQALGDADVDDEGVGRERVVRLERRQALRAVGGGGKAGDRLGRGDGEMGRKHEGAEAVGARAEAAGGVRGQRERLDADDAETAVRAGEVALEDGRDLPAGAAEGEPVGERHPPAARRRDRRGGVAADDGGGAGIAGARLGVQGLDAAPAARSRRRGR